MGAVDTTYTFTATDTITSTKMNNIIDQTTITTDAIIGTTLDVASGKLKIRSSGITSNEMGANSVVTTAIANSSVTTAKIANSTSTTTGVTTAKIADANVTTAKIADSSITAPKLNGAQTGTAPIYGVRAWVRFDGTKNSSGGSDLLNTNRLILGSGNVSSVLKNESGDYTVTFTTPMPSANYVAAGQRSFQNGDSVNVVIQGHGTVSPTANAFRFYALTPSAQPSNSPDIQVMIIG